MGVSSCTEPIVEEKLQTIMLKIDEEEFEVNSSIFSALQDSITIE